MPQSLSRIYLHIIFSTKNRERLLIDADLRKALHAYMGATMKQLECIRNQEEHHRKLAFQDEYRVFLRKHAVEFDERYVWD